MLAHMSLSHKVRIRNDMLGIEHGRFSLESTNQKLGQVLDEALAREGPSAGGRLRMNRVSQNLA